jgi:phosphoglycerol transferase MdoB-like AlkP superfamily enzyme
MVHFFIGFDLIPFIVGILLFILLIFIFKKYERRNEIKLSLFHWLIITVVCLVLAALVVHMA